MDCRTFESKIPAYIAGQLKMEEMQEFLDHAESCSECYDELEITYTVMQGIRQLDSEDGLGNASHMSLDSSLYFARERVRNFTLGRVIKYALTTAAFWSVLSTLWFQVRFWLA
ncbi:MAG: zf-HC2 domain-containing protein [Lachnospiraceae bacterium]|jgi:hypothetical protein|nr:zf-HC2 domain-containing protein [Lachnospiraceae bacterium]